MSSVSSRSEPEAEASLSRSYFSKDWSVFVFIVTSSCSDDSCSSKDFCSFEINLPSNYCSRPPYVTVKSIIVAFAASSGEK
jgi:hypothetical protein